MLDSAQLRPHVPDDARSLVDLGSGAGFPGLVLAMLGVPDVHLIESDARKAAFLMRVSRETSTPVTVHAKRIESIPSATFDVITARALGPLDRLIDLALPLAHRRTVFLFPKGQHVERELTEATKNRRLRVETVPSISDPRGVILCFRRCDVDG